MINRIFFSIVSIVFFTNLVHANICNLMLEPLKVQNLVKNVDYKGGFDPKSINPSYDKVVFDASDKSLLADKKVPLNLMTSRDRLIETDFGFAVMDVDELRDWSRLSVAIADPMASKEFVEYVAKTPGSFPSGILPESAEWLRWSVYAIEQSIIKSFKDNPDDGNLEMRSFLESSVQRSRAQRAEYRRLVRQKEIFMFPFGQDTRGDHDEMRPATAQVVLATLARYFLLSKLYVQRPDGEYRLLSEFLDKDSIMLMSRFPELLPSHPVFEGGHFAIDHEHTKIGHDDMYTLSERTLQKVKVNESDRYSYKFVSNVSMDLFEENFELDGFFRLSFYNNDEEEMDTHISLTRDEFESIFRRKRLEMEKLVARQYREFEEATGYSLPSVHIEEVEDSEHINKEYMVTFDGDQVPAYIKTAFFVFMAQNK